VDWSEGQGGVVWRGSVYSERSVYGKTSQPKEVDVIRLKWKREKGKEERRRERSRERKRKERKKGAGSGK
jgi:hypothetical protein